ncbi:MAG: Hsp20/alpha crystallin family protein [Gammaproteobacteria bacterium]|nr:Hsp20/alpha crystallin family protein [Gammaproteobacteria bacterium]
MTAHRYDPFINLDGLHRLSEEFGRMVEGDWLNPDRTAKARRDWRPAADTFFTDDAWKIVIDLPGVLPTSVEVSVQQHELIVSGVREAHDMSGTEDSQVRRERPSGRFERRFDLPDNADDSAITAKGEQGVLTISVPLGASTTAKSVDINWTAS